LEDTVELFTLQSGKDRAYRANRAGLTLIDTTVKGKNPLFAPTWPIVLGHKNGTVSDEEYTREYKRLMLESWTQRKDEWIAFLKQDGWVGIYCYCPAGAFCHRLLLVKMFEQLCERLAIPFTYYGEFE
jgi:hypothetical protein